MRTFDVGTYVVCTFGDKEIMAKVVYNNMDGKTLHVELEDNEFNIKYRKMKIKNVRHTDEMEELSSDEYLDLMILARSLSSTDLYYFSRNKLKNLQNYSCKNYPDVVQY